ncbi:MAG: GTP-binding protein, partial [Gemmatimonadetes bacterium]|nr:GTP-binding protein [Gemmatimonadota bacterium]
MSEQLPTSGHAIALVGNPNTGKTTLFNALTGLSQRVGNYPGVTVQYSAGQAQLPQSGKAQIIDLPGTYSLSASSPDEAIAVDVLLGQQEGAPPIDLVVAIADASNLRRHLYLLSQILETGHRVVLGLNMMDLAQDRDIHVDVDALSSRLGIPIVPLTSHRGTGIDDLIHAIDAALQRDRPEPTQTHLPKGLIAAAGELCRGDDASFNSSVEALRVLVDVDGHLERRAIATEGQPLRLRIAELRETIHADGPLSSVESEARYAWIAEIVADTLRGDETLRPRHSDRI